MSQHYILKNQFDNLTFAQKIKKSYFGWCRYLLSIYTDKKFYVSLKKDFLYFKSYISIPEVLFYFCVAFLFLSNIVLFPIYALLLKLYWKYRYLKTLKTSSTPSTDMIVFDPTNIKSNGLKVLKIISEHSTNETIYYKVLLENKEIHTITKENLLFERDLLNKKIQLEKELEKVNYSLDMFTKKLTYDDKNDIG